MFESHNGSKYRYLNWAIFSNRSRYRYTVPVPLVSVGIKNRGMNCGKEVWFGSTAGRFSEHCMYWMLSGTIVGK